MAAPPAPTAAQPAAAPPASWRRSGVTGSLLLLTLTLLGAVIYLTSADYSPTPLLSIWTPPSPPLTPHQRYCSAALAGARARARAAAQAPTPARPPPLLCVAVVSCRRLALLNDTLAALRTHLTSGHARVTAEVVWVDNGSEPERRAALAQYYAGLLTRVEFLDENCGLAEALNVLYASLCSAPYVLVLEEDWRLRTVLAADTAPLRRAVDVLAADAAVGTVYLRGEADLLHDVGTWRTTPRSGVEYRHHCARPKDEWGAYTNGASLMRRATLARLGPMLEGQADKYAAEREYSTRHRLAGLCAAELRLVPGCAHSGCNAAFDHTGRVSSTGWDDAKGRPPSPPPPP